MHNEENEQKVLFKQRPEEGERVSRVGGREVQFGIRMVSVTDPEAAVFLAWSRELH